MKSIIKYIGVIDNNKKQHVVEFFDGVNVITGRSSTGKSAIIEIFDYCFGKKENTIPHGIITENAQIYFCVMKVNNNYIVLARENRSSNAFIRDESSLPSLEQINLEYFSEEYFLPLETFNKALNNHFNLKVTDTDIDLEARNYRKNKAKAPCASVRNFVSFMLQHQNLIANKHALFYRFDEKEKRDQTIDQFKIFLGFVDQEYYLKKQELAKENRELKKLQLLKENQNKELKDSELFLSNLLDQYEYITGQKFPVDNSSQIITDPMNSLNKIESFIIKIEDNEDSFKKKYEEYENNINELEGKIHNKVIESQRLRNSIKAGEKYKQSLDSISTINSAELFESKCPFCNRKNENILTEANKLKDAINWLNGELLRTPVLTNTFAIEEKKINTEIAELKKNRDSIILLKQKMEDSIKEIKEKKSRFEQALKIKVRIESFIQDKLIGNDVELQKQIDACNEKIDNIEKYIKDNYDITKKLKATEENINNSMNEIGQNLDFEKTYQPINLNFSLDTFDLYFKVQDKKVYLRSVGSGANWLACHISLFTALLKLFCQKGDTCLIPPVLFLDQPSQVYFPISTDIENEFNAKKLKEKEGKETETDDDLKAVTNLYQQLVNFCKVTFEETNIMPQIIVTDHADKLKLENCDFNEDLVKNRRWRNKGDGFIKMNDD